MDKSAIEQIQTTALAAALIDKLPSTDTPIAALPNNFSITDLEHYQAGRTRYRGKFATTSLADFAEYSNVWEADACYIDADNMRATSIINQGDAGEPEHCDHTAALTLKKSAAFRALLEIDGQRKSQRELAEWLEEWRHCFLTDDDNGMKKTIAAIRRIKIEAKAEANHSEGSFSSAKSALESIEAKSAEGELPSFLTFACRPYEPLTMQHFSLRLSLITGADSKPCFVLRIQQLDTATEEIAQDFKDILSDKIDAKQTDIYIGTFAP